MSQVAEEIQALKDRVSKLEAMLASKEEPAEEPAAPAPPAEEPAS